MMPERTNEGSLGSRIPIVAEDRDAVEVEALSRRSVGLVDAVDHLLNKGACVVGDATISLGGVDLIYLGLSLVVSSVETLRRSGPGPTAAPALPGPAPRTPEVRAGELGRESGRPGEQARRPEGLLDPGPDELPRPPKPEPPATVSAEQARDAGNGLAQLVLTLVELLRQILERQAIRRMEGTSLTEEEIERMGVALSDLETKMMELRDLFGLAEEDLNIDLGPLGRLL